MKKSTPRVTKRCIPGVTLHPRDGYYQIRHIGLTAQRVKTDPVFHNTRREARKFAHIVKVAKTINDAIFHNSGIKKTLPRLITLVKKVLNTHTTDEVNTNNPAETNWSLLQNFESDPANPWHAVINVAPAIAVDHCQEQVTVTFPAIIPAAVIHPPPGIVHCRLFTLYAAIDTSNYTCHTQKARTTIIPCCNSTIQLKPLVTNLQNAAGTLHLLAIGVEWYSRNNPNSTLQRSPPPALLRVVHTSVTPKTLKEG
jgi:hypothetical protein